MQRLITLATTFFLLSLGTQYVRATHIVGAELVASCLSDDPTSTTYNLDLILYRDCINGQAPYDPTIYIYIFDAGTGALFNILTVSAPPTTPQIQPNNWGPCVAFPPPICVERGVYSTVVTLPDNAAGYDVSWARCCRNGIITNLTSPLEEGVTFLSRIPPHSQASCNSMPSFNQFPQVFLCKDEPFAFDHSATDPDGDSLVYAITNPFTGTNFQALGAGNDQLGGNPPRVGPPFNNPMGPPPYDNVGFAPGYSFLNPFGSNNMSIDPNTGFLTLTPNQTGIFVFAISVFEFRNGVLLSENKRDFQIHVIDCLPQGVPPEITHDLSGLNTSGDTIFVEGAEAFCYDFTVTDVIPTDVLNAYPASGPFTNFFPPATFSFTGTNPINGTVCWTPACIYDGQVIPIIIGAEDLNTCDNFGDVFDTVWVSISVPPNSPPDITPDLTGFNLSGDTIVLEVSEPACVDFTISDPNLNDVLTVSPLSPIFNDPNNPATLSLSGTNPINAQVCWTPDCDFADQLVPITLAVEDSSACKNGQQVTETVWIKVILPPNSPPAISTDLAGNQLDGDTIVVEAEGTTCFDFTLTDPDAGDVLTPISVSPIFQNPDGPTLTSTGTNPLNGQICWTPGCQFEGQTVELIFGGEDPGDCSVNAAVFDTVYVKVVVPPNAPPTITADLSGNTFNGDTIFVFANDGLCFDFTATDPNAGDILTAIGQSPIFGQAGGPSLTTTPGNPATGQVCWTPDCQFVGDVVELIIHVADDAACSSQADAQDTVYVQIDLPPNDPPTASHDLSGLNTDGDTILVLATEAFCYNVTFSDINVQDSLTFFTGSPVFNNTTNPPSFSLNGTNPLQAQICWTPQCENEGQTIPLIVGAFDNGACNNNLEVRDTVWVRIVVPFTTPPVVGQDLSGLSNVQGDTVYMQVEDSICYSFFIADLTPDMGIDYSFAFEDIFNNQIGVSYFNVEQKGDSILGEICFKANCGNGGALIRSIVTGIDLKMCPPFQSRSDTVYIKVNTDFKSFAGRDTFFCEGTGGLQIGAVPIGGDAPYFYQWYCDDPGNCGFTNSNSNDSTPTVNPTQTTTYFVQITDRNGCTSEVDDITVTVRENPIVDVGPDLTICRDGVGVKLLGEVVNDMAAPGPYEYQWSPAIGLNDPTIKDPYAIPDTTTIYTLVVTSANTCSSFSTTIDSLSTLEITVNPTPEVEAGFDQDVCFGDTVKLEGFAFGSGPDYDYVWTPSIDMADSSSAVTEVSPELTTTYYFIAISKGCPSNADSVTVNVRAIPTVTAQANYEVCGGDSVKLFASGSGDLNSPDYTFAWSPGLGLSDSTIAGPMASPDQSTIYEVVATSVFGCESPGLEVPVSVIPSPVVDLRSDTVVCGPQAILLEANYAVVGGPLTGPVFFNWFPENLVEDTRATSNVVSPDQTTRYYVSARSGSCITTDSVLITVVPPISVDIVADTNVICSADSLLLTAVGGRGATTYRWSPVGDLSDTVGTEVWALADQNTPYVLTATEGICVATDTLFLTVNPSPEVDYRAMPLVGCTDLEVIFDANTQFALAYQWDFGDGSEVNNAEQARHMYTLPGEYPVSLTAVGIGGCETSATLDTIRVFAPGRAFFDVDPAPGVEIVLPDAELRLLDASQGAVNYFWDFGDGNSSSEANPTHFYQRLGNYTVSLTITDAGGCMDTYTVDPIRVVNPEVLIPNVFTPNDDGINDAYEVLYTGKSPFSLEIVDRWGRRVFRNESAPLPGWNGIAPDGTPAEEGVYYYMVRIGGELYRGSLTLMR